MLEHILSWWGIITLAVVAIGYAFYDFHAFKAKLVALIFVAEERARDKCLVTGKAKMDWVVESGYRYLPLWLKLVLSETAFRALVQVVFDGLVVWADRNRHR